MKNHLVKLLGLALVAVTTFSCKKEYDDNNLAPLAPSLAEIPVTVTNFDFFERFPVIVAKGNFTAPVPPSTTPVPAVPTAASPGNFTITFSIPSDKGTIKEITRVATGVNGLTVIQSGTPATQLNYNTTTATVAPIAGNGSNTVTFSSSLFAYTTYRARVGTTAGAVATLGTPQAPTQLLYYFLLTLNTPNGEIQVIPVPVRVRVVE